MERKEMPIRLEAGGKFSQGKVIVNLYSTNEKQKRAWKALFLFLGLGIVSVILPLVHFFLVPGFLLASPFAYRWAKQQSGVLANLDGPCPFCEKPLAYKGGGLQWPLRFGCPSCGEPVKANLQEND